MPTRSAELFPEGDIEYKTINLMEGENFAPSFIKKVNRLTDAI